MSKRIQTAAVIGAGAIGAYFINGLMKKDGIDLYLAAEGERAERLRADGVVINGEIFKPEVKSSEELAGVDLIIVGVKYGGLQSALRMLQKMTAEHTLIISPLNGVDSEEIISEAVGKEHVVMSMMKIVARRLGNEIVYDPEITPGVYFGEEDGSESERVKALRETFDNSEVHYVHSADIRQDVWFKYALNISKNLPQAIISCGYGAYTDSEHLAYISDRMRTEVEQVATAIGVDITDRNNPAARNAALSPAARFSTLQDLDAGRETEIEMFSGTLMRMAKKLGIAVPFNEFAYHAIKCLEEKNAGKIS